MSKECPKCGYKSVANEDADICPECGSEMQYTRSGLFMEQIRVIKEMREADERNGRSDESIRPRFMLWENVVGAFSSNKGEDFRAVLEETAKVKDKTATIPRPPKGKWNTEGCIVGDGWSIAWRVLDAQFWGVPQRRRRIALVADFAGQCAGEILFKREGLSRNFTESRKEGQTASGDIAKGTDASGEHCIGFEPGAATRTGGHTYDNQTGSLRANMGDNQFCVAKEEQYAVDFGRVADRIQMNATKAVTMYTLNTTEQHAVAYGLDRASFNQGINAKYDISIATEQSQTLVSRGPNAVAQPFEMKAFGKYDESGKASCLKSRDYKDATDLIVEPSYIVRRLTPIECSRLQGFPDFWLDGLETPEPTGHDIAFWREVFETHRKVVTGAKKPKTDKQIIKWLQNPYSDGAAYKLWGNGIALPCFLYVVEGIKEVLDRTSTE